MVLELFRQSVRTPHRLFVAARSRNARSGPVETTRFRIVTVVRSVTVGVAALGALFLTAGVATAAPKAATPTSVQIAGNGVDGKLDIQQTALPKTFSSLMDEISWLATAKAQMGAPAAGKLGAKYTVTVYAGTTATQTYDLYPLANGGPRAHRPAKQPGGKKVSDGWFFGRLTMSETLRVAGVPLEAKPDVITGGLGGGVGEDLTSPSTDTAAGVNNFVDSIRRLLLLNGAVLIVICFGLAGIAFLIRRKI